VRWHKWTTSTGETAFAEEWPSYADGIHAHGDSAGMPLTTESPRLALTSPATHFNKKHYFLSWFES
jgi:hypothetical protein